MSNKTNYRWRWTKRTSYVSKRSGALVRFSGSLALTSRGSEARQATFDKLCEFMLQAGGVYTKFLQSVLLGVPEVQNWAQRRQVDFFEHVPPEPLPVGEIMQRELGNHVSRLRLWPDVLASGTFAQVYAGILDADQQIIVKVQRQSINLSLKHDIWVLKKFVRYGRPFLTSMDADLGAISRDFARITLAEVDYIREARLGEQLRLAAVGPHPNLCLPQTYRDLSTAHVLIQERMGGVSLAELIQHATPLSKEQRYSLQQMMESILLLPFTTGLVYADPHPGNMRLLEDGRVALLDFGAIDERPVSRAVYEALLTAIIRATDGTLTASEALDAYFAAYAPKLHRALGVTSRALGLPPVLELFAKVTMGSQSEAPQSAFKGSILALANINKMVNPNNRFALRSSLQNVSYARSVHTMMQTMQLLGLQDEIVVTLRNIEGRLQDLSPFGNNVTPETMSVFEAKEIVYHWLERVIERNPLMAGDLRRIFDTLRNNRTPDSPPNTHPQA
jgi:hypothetical protein